MEHLLFAAYLIFFAWLVTKVTFFTASGLTKPQLVIVFLLKVIAGILYGWIGVYYGEMAQMVDTWAYHFESVKETQHLLSQPGVFFSDIFHSSYQEGYSNFLASKNSWWNDLKGNSFLKLLAVFNVFSFSQYYINVIFYSFLSLFGPIALFRVMRSLYPESKVPILLTTFLVPSFLYWTSGLHKDGLVFLGLAVVVYHVYFGLKEARFSFPRVLMIVLGLLTVLALRNFLIVPLLPALLAWVAAGKTHFRPWLVFAGIYGFFIVLFFTAKYLSPQLNFPAAVVDRQQAFLSLGGNSAVEVTQLEPTFFSFLLNAPQAFALSVLRPYPSDVHHLLSLAAAAEINFLLLLSLVCLVYRRKGSGAKPAILFFFFFSLSVLLMIGYTVNVLGAVVRYRSVVLTLLLLPIVGRADWQKLKQSTLKYIQ